MHASAFLIRETKSGRRFARFFPLRIFMGACNQGRKVLEFLLWGRHCRHSFGFSRNNMKGALYHWRNLMVRNAKKGKFLIFRFWRCQGLRDEVPNVLRFLNEIEKPLSAPSKFDGSAGDNLQNGFNKIAEIRRNYFVIVL